MAQQDSLRDPSGPGVNISVGASSEQTTRDRKVCIAFIAACIVLLVLSVVIFAIFAGDVTDWLDDNSTKGDDPVTVILWFLAGISVWVVVFVPLSFWMIPCAYFLDAWPGLLVILLNVLAGQTCMFMIGRLMKQTTRVGARLVAVAPEQTELITSLMRIFRAERFLDKGWKLCFLVMFGPTSTPMLCWVVGLLTEAHVVSFSISAYVANILLFSPLVVLALEADNLSDAFSNGDGLTIGLIVGGVFIFIGAIVYATRVARKEVAKMANQEEENTNGRDVVIAVPSKDDARV